MTQGNPLNDTEKALIKELSKAGKSSRYIGGRINRGKDVVLRFLKNSTKPNGVLQRGITRKFLPQSIRIIRRQAKTGNFTARNLRDQYAPDVTVRRVQQILADDPDLQWEKPRKAPSLSITHRQKRLDWARQMTRKGERFWRKVIFSDESRFTLDGPDGLSSYWRDVRRPGRWHTSRRANGGGVMIWACFSYEGKSQLYFVEGNLDSSKYCTILEQTMLPFLENNHTNGAVFQQDNASCHVSEYTKKWFFDMDVNFMDWPACSPDQNPIENLWATLAQRVYNNGRQFMCLSDLKEALQYEWDAIDRTILRNLINSMPDRLLAVIEARGGATKY